MATGETLEKSGASGISFSRILNPKPGEWPSYNGKLDANRYSELDQINTGNVHQLALKWELPLSSSSTLESTPIVVDGIMYVTGPNSIYALDALTGREIWHFRRPRTPDLTGDGATGINRGVAVLGDKVFLRDRQRAHAGGQSDHRTSGLGADYA